jgi:tetratricopeptide (TPR) repeat protein
MTCEQCSDWLVDAVDRTLDLESQAQLDAHCRACASCRELLDDLTEIRVAAATLDRHTPSPELWRAIAAQTCLASPTRPAYAASLLRRGRLPWPQLAAAAALMIVLGTAAWFAAGTRSHPNPDGTSNLVRNATSELQQAEQHYQNAIAALEQLTVAKDNALDPVVAAEIAQSLKSIDRAIADSRAALKSNPDSFVAQTSLLEALRMKVSLLQETVSLMNARS